MGLSVDLPWVFQWIFRGTSVELPWNLSVPLISLEPAVAAGSDISVEGGTYFRKKYFFARKCFS